MAARVRSTPHSRAMRRVMIHHWAHPCDPVAPDALHHSALYVWVMIHPKAHPCSPAALDAFCPLPLPVASLGSGSAGEAGGPPPGCTSPWRPACVSTCGSRQPGGKVVSKRRRNMAECKICPPPLNLLLYTSGMAGRWSGKYAPSTRQNHAES